MKVRVLLFLPMTKQEIKKLLDNWGFEKYVRYCKQPDKNSYENEVDTLEEWSNDDVADFIIDEIL